MARAAFYYYVPESSCLFCHKATAETRRIANPVQDLGESEVAIPCHRVCYRTRVAGLWLYFALAWLSAAAALIGLEVAWLAAGRHGAVVTPPLWALVCAAMAGLIGGAIAGFRRYDRFLRRIQDYIQLRTYPYD
jgi:hypothetical protein